MHYVYLRHSFKNYSIYLHFIASPSISPFLLLPNPLPLLLASEKVLPLRHPQVSPALSASSHTEAKIGSPVLCQGLA